MIESRNIQLASKHGRFFLADVFYKASDERKPIVILSHGFKGFKDWGVFDLVATEFVRNDFVFVKFNFSHNGTTTEHPLDFVDEEAFGQNNFSKELDDLGVVIDWLFSEKFPVNKSEIDRDKVYLIGHSRGGGITILKAAEDNRISKLVTWASVNEFGKFWKQDEMKSLQEQGVIYVENSRTKQRLPIYVQMYENYFANIDRLHIPSAVKHLSIPLLLIHGTNDEAVPLLSSLEMKEWQPNAELLVIENANHVFGAKHPWTEEELPNDYEQVVKATLDFFKS